MISRSELDSRYKDMVKKVTDAHRKLAKAHSKEAERYEKIAQSHRKISEAHQDFVKHKIDEEEANRTEEEENKKIIELNKELSESRQMETETYTNIYNMLRLVHPEADSDVLMLEVAVMCSVPYDRVMENVTDMFFGCDAMGGCYNYIQ